MKIYVSKSGKILLAVVIIAVAFVGLGIFFSSGGHIYIAKKIKPREVVLDEVNNEKE